MRQIHSCSTSTGRPPAYQIRLDSPLSCWQPARLSHLPSIIPPLRQQLRGQMSSLRDEIKGLKKERAERQKEVRGGTMQLDVRGSGIINGVRGDT